jgi:hypothetical protein
MQADRRSDAIEAMANEPDDSRARGLEEAVLTRLAPGGAGFLLDHYRCAAEVRAFEVAEPLGADPVFFRFGRDAMCYGRTASKGFPASEGGVPDLGRAVEQRDGSLVLPFDPQEVLDNLRFERYVKPGVSKSWVEKSWTQRAYYALRPALPVAVRKHMQRAYFRWRRGGTFPAWPLDRSADVLLERLLVLAMETLGTDRIPFIWFWPDEHRAAAILTHDVETAAGRDFTSALMDLDEAAGVLSAFQIVPEDRYSVTSDYVAMIRERGFEVNLHGLNHDGNMFGERAGFLAQAARISEYAERFGVRGFRSPSLYRNIDWFADLPFAFDMSIPNVARFEAQPGGCCTVMPYFLPGGMLELPLTMTEDYTLFHILSDHSMTLWKSQAESIVEAHGLMSVLVHPDYVIERRAQDVYKQLLGEIDRLRAEAGLWVALPGEVDRWWRQRAGMELVGEGGTWRVEGEGSDRASVAYACLDGGGVSYEVQHAEIAS